MKKTLHILGGGLWQVPTVRLAKQMGFRVLVTDIYEERPAYALADRHEVIDVRHREKTLAAARRHRIDGILCDTTDVGVPTAAYVAEKLRLPGIGLKTALNFTYKHRMRKLTTANGVPGPRWRAVDSIKAARAAVRAIGLPVVLKPTDSQSSRGVTKIERGSDLDAAFETAMQNSQQKKILVEEFIRGTEVTVESLRHNNTTHVLGVSDKKHFKENPMVASELIYPPRLAPKKLGELHDINNRVIESLGLQFGVTHAEYLVNANGIYLVEIAARGGGNRIYSHIIPHLTGVNVPRAVIQWTLGIAPDLPARLSPKKSAGLAFFKFRPGRVRAVAGQKKAANVHGINELVVELKVGDHYRGVRDDRSRPGYALAFGITRKDVVTALARAKKTVSVTTTSLSLGATA